MCSSSVPQSLTSGTTVNYSRQRSKTSWWAQHAEQLELAMNTALERLTGGVARDIADTSRSAAEA